MTRLKTLLLGVCILIAVTVGTMAFTMPQEIVRLLPITATLFGNKPKNTEKPLVKPTALEKSNPTLKTDSVSFLNKSGKGDTPEAATAQIPVQVTYLFLFRQLAVYEEKAKEAESRGEDSTGYRNMYQRLANLTTEQNAFLMQTAISCAAEVKLKDEAAKQIADQIRARIQADIVAGKTLPPPSPNPELVELQKQRDEIILKYREILKNNFAADFDRFEAFLESQITANITSDITPEMRNNAKVPPPDPNLNNRTLEQPAETNTKESK